MTSSNSDPQDITNVIEELMLFLWNWKRRSKWKRVRIHVNVEHVEPLPILGIILCQPSRMTQFMEYMIKCKHIFRGWEDFETRARYPKTIGFI